MVQGHQCTFSQRLLQATKAGWSPGNDDEVSTFNRLPNILLDGWEGLKAYTFQKRQSKGAHFEKVFRRATRCEITSHFLRRASRGAAWPLHFKFASYAYAMIVLSGLDMTWQKIPASGSTVLG